jgi:redox-sensitive bicupin YhaK (pirin superfamily)
MLTLRKAGDRGRTDWGWLDSRHTFSFGEYYDPRQTGFRSLRVLNDDRVKAGAGFGTHGHRDMEILSYVLQGALAHKDSTGGGGVIRPGEIQFMRAGIGVTHSEMNASRSTSSRSGSSRTHAGSRRATTSGRSTSRRPAGASCCSPPRTAAPGASSCSRTSTSG